MMQAASANTPLPPKPNKRAHVNPRSTSGKQRNNLPIGTPSRTFLGNPHLAPRAHRSKTGQFYLLLTAPKRAFSWTFRWLVVGLFLP